MKAALYLQVECPACGFIMQRLKNSVFCSNAACENYRLFFERPSVELQPLPVDALSEMFTAAARDEEQRPL